MKKFIVASALALSLLVPGVAFAALTETQIAAVLGLLRAFNADASALYDVEASLRGEVLGATVACPALTMTLQRGMSDATTGGQVTKLQTFLTAYYGLTAQDSVTGYFGSVTQRTVIRFQTEQGLSPVGVVGVQTRAKIASVCSGGSVSTTPILKPGPICPALAFIPMECAVGAPSPRYDANGCQTGWVCTSTPANPVLSLKSYPTVTLESVPAGGLADGRLMRFKVTAQQSGAIGLTQLFLTVSPTGLASGGGVRNVNVSGFSDSEYSTPISGVSINGALRSTDTCTTGCTANDVLSVGVTNAAGVPTAIQIPAGTTRYFEVRGTVTGAQSGASITTKLMGDGVYSTPVSAVSMVGKDAYFIWSPNSTTTATRSDQDWYTGYGVPGLPSNGLSYTRTGSVTTPMPLPVITGYTASPTAISVGQSATLMWSTTGTTDGGCHIYLGASGTNVNTAGLPGSGSFTVTPSVTTAYRLWCTNSWKDGSQNVERTVTVTVQNPTAPKPIACPLMIYTPVSCTGTTLPKYDANGCLTGVMCQEKPVTEGIFVPGSENSPFQQ